MDAQRELLRHAVATVAYRGAKALRGAPEGFATFKAGETTRTPGEILGHMGDLYEWALGLARGADAWKSAPLLPWDRENERFFGALGAFDAYLASDEALGTPAEKILQGPVADSLTHIGQLAMLRRLAGSALRGESYFRADVAVGRVGPDQVAPRREF